MEGGGKVVGEGAEAGDELDVLAGTAVGAFHDDSGVVAEGARGWVVGWRGVREAGVGSVGVGGGGGGGDVVEGLDVMDLAVVVVEFGFGGEGANELVGARGLQGAESGVDGVEVGGRRARVGGPVEKHDAGGFWVGEYGVLLGFTWVECGFAAGLIVNFAGGRPFWSSGGHLELRLQPFPGSECHVPVEGVGEMLHRDNALVQDRDLIIWLRARHPV